MPRALNQQFTAVQQADYFLQKAEKQTLQLVHDIMHCSDLATVGTRAAALQKMLAQRMVLSGGYVDRQMQLNVQSVTQVEFHLPEGHALLNNPAQEVLTFSLDGHPRELSAVRLEGNAPVQHNLLRLNQALGKLGIRGRLNSDNELIFTVEEQRWPRVSQHLSIQKGGKRNPGAPFCPLRPQLAIGLEEMVTRLSVSSDNPIRFVPALEKIAERLTRQRHFIQQIRSLARQRINNRVMLNGVSSARVAAKDFSAQLCAGNFDTLSQALAGQANLSANRVCKLLSGS